MPPLEAFEYAILRVVPDLERGEGVNVGVVLFCRTQRFLGARVALGERQRRSLANLAPDLDLAGLEAHLDAIAAIVRGETEAGPMARLDAPERFRWVTAPASTILQPSDVHGGLTDDAERELDELFRRLVA